MSLFAIQLCIELAFDTILHLYFDRVQATLYLGGISTDPARTSNLLNQT